MSFPNAPAIRRWQVFASVSRLHIALIAGLGAFTFGWLFTGTYPFLIAAVCALDWYIVNLINRAVDIKEDSASGIAHTEYIRRNRKRILNTTVVILFVSLVAVYFFKPAITPLRIAAHILGAYYNWPLLPGKRRLKQVYVLKNIASGIGFLLTVFGYPLVDAYWGEGIHGLPPGISWITVGFSVAFFFLFIQSYELIYDLRDIPGDTVAGIRTYAVVHGKRTSIYIVNGLIVSSIVVLVSGYVISVVPWRIFIMVAAPCIQLILFKRASVRGISAGDCTRMTWIGVGLLFIYHVWVAAELPGVNFH
jgi:4-hydroxybenzoate polyprenyltransferase